MLLGHHQFRHSVPLTENNVHTSSQAQVRLRMLTGSALNALAHATSPLSRWQGHTGIWMHSSSTHALKDLSLLEFYLSGIWAVSPHCHLDRMSFSQSQMPFTYRAHFTFFRKVAAADGRRQLFAVHIIPVQSFGVAKGKPFRQHKRLQSLLSQWDFILWTVLDLYFLQVNLQSGFSALKFCLVTKIEMNTQSWRFYRNSLT